MDELTGCFSNYDTFHIDVRQLGMHLCRLRKCRLTRPLALDIGAQAVVIQIILDHRVPPKNVG